MDEQELIRQLLAGNASAIRLFVDQYQPLILRTAKGFVGNLEDARDLTQETLVVILNNLHRFRFQSGLSTWVYRIAVNQSLNYIRRNKNRKNLFGYSIDQLNHTSFGPSDFRDHEQKNPSELLEQTERSQRIHRAIDALPDKQKTAFTLAEYDDLSYKEIANIMQLSVSSVESLLFRARKNLQKQLWKCYKNKPQVF